MSGFIKKTSTSLHAGEWDSVNWNSIEPERGTYRARKILKYVPKSGIHLDIGTGNGDGTLLLSQLKETVGIEYGFKSAGNAKNKGLEIFIGDGRSLPFINNCFQSVTCLDVIEHIPSPEQVIEEISRILANDGILIIQTPPRESFKECLLAFVRSYKIKKQKQPYDIPLSRDAIVEILKKFHFEILEERSIRYWAKNPIVHLISISRLYYCRLNKFRR
jgi:SAM-dependent methyltransferase